MSNLYEGLMPNEPVLMPNQAKALNGDYFACEEFLKLKEKYNVKNLIELGSCVFGSTNWFADNFEKVITVEINPTFREIGLKRVEGKSNIKSLLGDSINMLPEMLSMVDNRTIIFIDSHWQTLPLIDELKIIANSKLTPCIVVHDCLVPNEPNLGYDTYEGLDISYATMKPYLDNIYGIDEYSYHYNKDATSTIVKRGIIYIYPKLNSVEKIYKFM
jgi:hypothetical protein